MRWLCYLGLGARDLRVERPGTSAPSLAVQWAILAAILLLVPLRLGAQEYQVLHNFGGPGDGFVPAGALAIDPTGNLYGVTGGGPEEYGYGEAFELSPQGGGEWQETVLYVFPGPNVAPEGPLTLDMAGNLYGTAAGFGSLVFQLSRASGGWDYSVLYDQGAGPGVAIDAAGDLYGSIGPGDYFGIGAIGALTPGSGGWTYTDLANLGVAIGYGPPGPPVPDGRGGLIGVDEYGGVYESPNCRENSDGCGVLFDMTPTPDGALWTYNVLHLFGSFATDAQIPSGGLVRGPSGAIYGVTALGGRNDLGTIFQLTRSISGQTKDPWTLQVLYDFPDCSIGCNPGGTMAIDRAGNLYGIAGGGIADCGYTCGVIFRLAPQADGNWEYSVVHKFTGKDGQFPVGVTIDDKGDLFGTTKDGGTYNAGVAFEIRPGVYPVPTGPDAVAGEDED